MANARLEIKVGPQGFESLLLVDRDLELVDLSIDPAEVLGISRVFQDAAVELVRRSQQRRAALDERKRTNL